MLPDLVTLREDGPWSQRELAEKSGVSRSTIAAIELGKRRPRPRTKRALAKALGVSPSEISWGQSRR